MSPTDQFMGRLLMGRYRVVRRLAAGGMGVIYLARAEGAAGYAKPVVIKRLVPHLGEDDTMVRMFVREAHVLAQLSHPNIVDVLDFAEEDGAYLLVLEYVHGYHLGHWYRYLKHEGRPFPVDLALHVVASVLDALHYAHTRTAPDGSSATIVHRDVSPSNVLVDLDGYVKLADFGIARVSGIHTPYRTDTPSIKGKLSYMAPELLRAREPTPATDVFAAGVVLHEILRGRNEFYDRDMTVTMQRVVSHELTSLHALRDDVPDAIDEVVARATAKAPEDRYPDAAAFAAALRRLLPGRGADVATSLRERARRDFLGNLPEVRNVPRLEELEQAWRTPEVGASRVDAAPSPSSQPPTERGTPSALRDAGHGVPPATESPAHHGFAPDSGTVASEVARPIAQRPHASWTGVALATLIAVGAAVAVSWLTRERKQTAERFIVVQAAGNPSDVADPPGAADEPDATTELPRDAAPRPGDAGRRNAAKPADRDGPRNRRPDLQARLTRAFARQRPRIERCLREHADELPNVDTVHVRFELDRKGRVERVQLQPVTEGPVGRCLLRVARATHFPRTDRPIAFRIPVRIRR